MIIAHCADIHIRLLNRHDEYNIIFDKFYQSIKNNNVDLVVVVGDLLHNKLNLSPESIHVLYKFLFNLLQISDVIVIPGNHDCIVNQLNRMNSIAPIVKFINDYNHSHKLFFFENSAICNYNDKINFGVFAINDETNFPIDISIDADKKHIALFHGPVNGSQIDTGHIIKSKYDANEMFCKYDAAMLGDIHKYQAIAYGKGNHAVFPGSMIQQNFGENISKGYVLWNTDNLYTHDFIPLPNDNEFHTIVIDSGVSHNAIPFVKNVPCNSRIRVIFDDKNNVIDKSSIIAIVSNIKQHIDPVSVNVEVVNFDHSRIDKNNYKNSNISHYDIIDNLWSLGTQQKLILDYINNSNIDQITIDNVISMHKRIFDTYSSKKHTSTIDAKSVHQYTNWYIDYIKFDNAFSYGQNNCVDFRNMNGLIGVFAPNRYGKSALFSTILNGLFNMSDRVTKSNLSDIINFNENSTFIEISFHSNNRHFIVERKIERIKTNKTKSFLTLYEIKNDVKEIASENMDFNQTEEFIRYMIGNYNDHKIMSFGMQDDLSNFLNCSQSNRKDHLSRFIGLNIIDDMFDLIKTEYNILKKTKQDFESRDFHKIKNSYCVERDSILSFIKSANDNKSDIFKQITNIKYDIKQKELINSSTNIVRINDIDEFKNELNIKRNNKLQLEKQSVELTEILNNHNNLIESIYKQHHVIINKNNLHDIIKSIDEQNKLISNIDMKLSSNKIHTDDCNQSIQNLSMHEWFENNDFCKKCNFLSDARHKKHELINYQSEQLELLKSKKLCVDELKQLNDILQIYKEYDHHKQNTDKISLNIDNISNKLQLLNMQISNDSVLLDQNLQNIDNICVLQTMEKLHNMLSEYENKIIQIEERINTKNFELGSIVQKIENIDKLIDKFNQTNIEFDTISLLKDMFSKNGIPLFITKKIIPTINNYIFQLLCDVVDFEIYISVDDDNDGIYLFLKDKNGISRPLEMGSGMEKTIASIAIRASLAKISFIPKCNLFVIDEGFGCLDFDNLKNVEVLLQKLKSMFDIVLIISHIKETQDMVDHIITINKDEKNGYSTIQIEN